MKPAVLAMVAVALATAACGASSSGNGGGPSGTASPGPSISVTSSTTSSTGAAVAFTNPVFPANFADPQIVQDGNSFVAIATNGNAMNVQTLVSTDMAHWDQGQDALPKLASWTTAGKVWAPETRHWSDGSWRMYYTTRGADPQWQCISVATAAHAAGPYTDTSSKPLVCQTSEGGSIDPSPFVDSSGRAWLYWKNDGNAIGRDTWITVQRLSPDGRSLQGKAQRLFKQTEPWEGHLVEAPAVVEVDGRFHLFYSANDYGSADYAVGHATASSPTGPFRKDPEPVLTSNSVAAGPGHCQLIKVHGRWWMMYHAWAPDAVGDEASGRQMWLSTVTFQGDKVVVQPPTTNQPTLP